ncbi:MAG: hypothetical protein ACFBSF_20655 [Leptolyngbyaceae cyanobacterium]
MFHPSESGSPYQPPHEAAPRSEPAPAAPHPIALPAHHQDVLRMFLLGDYGAIRTMVNRLATNGIADATRWTPLQPTGREDEYITVHTKRMAPETR